MKNPLWAVAVALPLLLGGCERQAADNPPKVEPPKVEQPKVDEVVSVKRPPLTDEQKQTLRAPLMALAKVELGEKAIFGATTTVAWEDVIGKDLPLHYVRCKVPVGVPPIPDQDCHLYVKQALPHTPGKPVRWLRFEENDDGTMWAGIRSEEVAKEYLVCDSLEVDSSFLSGSCDFKPHQNSAVHWLEFVVFMSTNRKRESVFFVYYDEEPKGDGDDVHNGEGHGGSD